MHGLAGRTTRLRLVQPYINLLAYARNYRYGGWSAVRGDGSAP
jgi:hypothetical protein